MLGVPEGERQQIRHWLDLMLHREPGEMDPTPEGSQAALEAGIYFLELAQERRRRPADDMISRLIEAQVDRGASTPHGRSCHRRQSSPLLRPGDRAVPEPDAH